MNQFDTDDCALRKIVQLKYGPPESWGWGVQLRSRFNYFTPDDRYEAYLLRAVDQTTSWLDVGCGRATFPHNPNLSKLLSERCGLLVGLDPSDNIHSNPYVHERVQCPIQDYHNDGRFDLITLRMVAEHIADPATAIDAFARLLRPAGMLVLYTVWKWSPASIAAAWTPMGVHHWAKRLLWNSEERDTFPVVYKMNTRAALRHQLLRSGFCEEHFEYLDDCRSFQKSRRINTIELYLRSAFRALGLRYPEACILASYSKLA